MTDKLSPVPARERLSEQEVADAEQILHGIVKLMPGLLTEPWSKISGTAKVYLFALQTAADLAEAKERADRAMHFHRKNECPKCRRVCTQATDNDYGAGKYGVYDAACPCEAEAERDAAEASLTALQEAAREAVVALAGSCCCGRGDCDDCRDAESALAALRKLLEPSK